MDFCTNSSTPNALIDDIFILPVRHQAIISTNAGIMSIVPLWSNFSGKWIEVIRFTMKNVPAQKMYNCQYHSQNDLNHNGATRGLVPNWGEAIIWTNVDLLPNETLETNLGRIWIKLRILSVKKGIWKYSPCSLSIFVLSSIYSW